VGVNQFLRPTRHYQSEIQRQRTSIAAQDKHCLNNENEPHNLDSRIDDERRPPSRSADKAGFAAEAHSFTGYEKAGQGSPREKSFSA
jgi:hypothetical protein